MKKNEGKQNNQGTVIQLTIRGVTYPVELKELKHETLMFYADNPRVYSALHTDDGAKPTQEEIQEHLQKFDYIRELRDDIRENEDILEPLYVKSSTYEVVEGNSRLAAFRMLADENSVQWQTVKCAILPPEVTDSAIASLLGQLHLKGKKDWSPYEQASYLHRRHYVDKVSLNDLKKEFNLKENSIRHRIAVITFMIRHGDNHTGRWSHYDEFLKNRKFRKACEDHADFEGVVVSRIKSGDMKAVEVRDKLKLVCSTKSERPIKHLIKTGSLDGAVTAAKELGGNHNVLQSIRRYKLWFVKPENLRIVKSSDSKIREELNYELRLIKRSIEKMLKSTK